MLAHLGSKVGLLALAAICVLTWQLSHPYGGIVHDAVLYTLQAHAHSSPDSLAQDVFLRYGSQDSYSLFSPVYALTIRLLGPDWAAAALTCLSQLALMVSAWLLARQLMPSPRALLACALFIALPGAYGAERVFTCIESFLTPRMLAEALVLSSLTAALRKRSGMALGLLGAALLIHPIMAAAGFAALLWKHVGLPHPRAAALLIGATTVVLAILSYALPPGPWGRFDAQWLQLVENRSPYLFLTYWRLDDWVDAAVPVATLAVGISVLEEGRARDLCKIVLATAISTMVLMLIACSVMRLVIFTQLQPWRCLWLSTAAAALLLPAIAPAAWSRGFAGRTAIVLLACSWMFGAQMIAGEIAVAAVIATVLMRHLRQPEARLVFFGACALLALALAWRVASNLVFTDIHYYDPDIPLRIRQLMSFTRDGMVPVALAILACWLAESGHGWPAATAIATLAIATSLGLAPDTWRRLTHRQFPPALARDFTAWRELIPRGMDVFWAGQPLATWLLLERPSYLSEAQTSGLVFSRPTALEMARRASTFGAGVSPAAFMRWKSGENALGLGPKQLEQACAASEFQYLVTSAKLDKPVLGQVPREVWPVSGSLRLYSCAKGTR
jgi:hypothetical protein